MVPIYWVYKLTESLRAKVVTVIFVTWLGQKSSNKKPGSRDAVMLKEEH